MFDEGISPSGLRPLGDILITSHLISQSISLNSSQYVVNIKCRVSESVSLKEGDKILLLYAGHVE